MTRETKYHLEDRYLGNFYELGGVFIVPTLIELCASPETVPTYFT